MNFVLIRRASVWTLLASFLLIASACVGETAATDVGREQVAAWIGQAEAPLLLDVRSAAEFAGGHIPGSVNIPHDQLAARIGEIAMHRERGVVVYCERGGRAVAAASVLAAERFTSIQHMQGDMSGWRAAGLPTE